MDIRLTGETTAGIAGNCEILESGAGQIVPEEWRNVVWTCDIRWLRTRNDGRTLPFIKARVL